MKYLALSIIKGFVIGTLISFLLLSYKAHAADCVPSVKKVVKHRSKKPAVRKEKEYIYIFIHDSIVENPRTMVVNNVFDKRPPNRLFGIIGSGPTGTNSTVTPTIVQIRTTYGSLFGLGYQRTVLHDYNIGFMFMSNYTTGVTLGKDF